MDPQTTETAARDPAAAAPQSTAVTVRQAREVRVVEDVAPLFDTAKFEHYGRIAAVMATATLIPDALRGSNREETVGNCFMVVSMADRLGGFDPWAVAQCCSIIQGKLMLEAKLVHAAIKRKLGIDLFTYYTGEEGSDDFHVYICDREFTDEMIADLEPGKGLRGYRVIDGSVKKWRTFEKSGAVKALWMNQPDLQLFYRGTRVWQRRYEPEIMLGVYTSDEMEELEQRAAPRAKRNLIAPLQEGASAANGAGAADTGFDRDHVASETGEERKDHQVVECSHEFEGEDEERVCKHCGVLEGDTPADETAGNSAGGDGDAPVVDGDGNDLEADAAFLADLSEEDTALVLSRLKAADKAGEKLAENPQAELGETYLLAGDAFTGKDKRRVTYKDGVAFSSVGPKGAEKLKVYAIHAEVPQQGDEGDDARPISEEAATGKDGAPSAANEPDTSASAGDASAASPEPPASSTAPSDDPIAEMVAAKFGAMGTWNEIKAEWAIMCKSTDWVGASAQDQDHIRRAAWPLLAALRVDQSQDITAFGIWMPTQKGRDGADAIRGTFDVLKRSDVWGKLTPAQAETLEKRVAATVASLTGSAG